MAGLWRTLGLSFNSSSSLLLVFDSAVVVSDNSLFFPADVLSTDHSDKVLNKDFEAFSRARLGQTHINSRGFRRQ